ncbi:DUF6351 family protein [Paracidovorax konjaci]|uniref:DUF6351 domain-containing protein n=1 Tax=Paracidovorax konjaci TaxID=32040 RepID=A0A1I1Y6W7_9BURK|nr:DUF6351 family protein [Paracidovorax konjaci]SFE15062.1 hypothetical protein SAMN04489710_11611 [Paracidovorax konjaci]
MPQRLRTARAARRLLSHPLARTLAASAALLGLLAACGTSGPQGGMPAGGLSVVSSPADLVSGGSARVAIDLPAGVAPEAVRISLNGTPVAAPLEATPRAGRHEWLLQGLRPGRNEVVATDAHGQVLGTLALRNHPDAGPLFSGPRLAPFECRTEDTGLGAPLDADCTAARRYDWFYVTAQGAVRPLADPLGERPADLATATPLEGRTVPFIVRVESGTINRSIYRIGVLADPRTEPSGGSSAWNRRIVFRFGESTGVQYQQGVNQATDVFRTTPTDAQSLTALSRGFAYVVSTLNIHRVNVNDVVSAETALRLREHIAKTYGTPRWMVGMGGSGGAIQQMLIAQNYPGILDGLMPDAAFPDVFSTAMAVSDCRLLNRWFQRHPASAATRQAFEGHLQGACANWDTGLGDALVATRGAVTPACGLRNAAAVYHPTDHPGGARCSLYDAHANSLGRDGRGHALRPLDNVGVQYGLRALRAGTLAFDDFVALNEGIGGMDGDGNLVPARTEAGTTELERAYATGRVGSGGGGLGSVPILHMRTYAEPGGDIHTLYNDLKIREQLVRANGQAGNQVIWVLPHSSLAQLRGLGAPQQQVLAQLARDTLDVRLGTMTQWLDGIAAQPGPATPDTVRRTRPAEAADACWDPATAQRITEPATPDGAGLCRALYPLTPPPRMAAGGPLSDDVLKCRLQPVAAADYAPFVPTPEQLARLARTFPQGVCDYRQPGVGQRPPAGTWQRY